MLKRPIIIDTDPGVDDTIAIMLANAHPELDIKAITPVLGNVSYKFTSENALGLIEYLGIDCKIGIGADQPLLIKGMDSDGVHGKGGLGGYMLKNSGRKFDGYAWDIIKDEAIKANGELELITLGPLTNIAITFMRYPEIKPLIKRIICMGGSAYEGNITPKAEFNVWVDPDAFNYVFHSGVPIVMCGLDSTEQAYLTIDELKSYVGRDTKIKDLFDHIFNFFINKRTNSTDDDKLQTIYDAITVAWALDESIGTTKKYYVTVETKGPNAGWTILDRRGKYKKEPNVEVLETADREKFKAMLEEMLDYYKN